VRRKRDYVPLLAPLIVLGFLALIFVEERVLLGREFERRDLYNLVLPRLVHRP
jgi:hypothetical protein